MATITIMDPVTRIEGHMKVKVKIDKVDGQLQIVNAWCTGTLFRGFETILQGRDPWDAPIITERICGVCPVSHGMASVLAIDAAAGRTPSRDARIMRNLVLGANYIQSHILHFYLLAAMDYVRGPNSAPWTPAWDVDMRSGLEIGDHLGQAIEARRRAHEMGAVFGGKMPLPHTYIPGGFTAAPTEKRVKEFRRHLQWLTDFIRNVYISDVEALAGVYSDYHDIGQGCGWLLAFGAFDLNEDGTRKLFRRGRVSIKDSENIQPISLDSIQESVTHSWYADSTDALNPATGKTEPVDPRSKAKAYSWLKAPRYNGRPYETGPLARMWVNGDYRNRISVMDRHLARAHETLKVAEAMNDWLDELNLSRSKKTSDESDAPSNGMGVGLTEAPRGALGHWVQIRKGKIGHYQVITPTCWNASPRDGRGIKGPMEQALIGTPVAEPDRPIEALRIIHSFDPCLSCAVHVMQPKEAVSQ